MIEVTEPKMVITIEGDDVEKFKSLIRNVQGDQVCSWDISFAYELGAEIGVNYREEEVW